MTEYQRQMYVSGSAAPQEVPQFHPVGKNKAAARIEKRRKLRRANKANLVYTLTAIGIVGVILGFCVSYLSLRTSVQAGAAEVASLQRKLDTMKLENNEAEARIAANVDYDQVYETAVKDLGMVYPGMGQIETYEAGDSEYVMQYSDVPKQ